MKDARRDELLAPVYEAWERFVQGDDQVLGVRPQVAISWHRCRERYRVDPHLTEAPIAVAEIEHTPEHDGSSRSWGSGRRRWRRT